MKNSLNYFQFFPCQIFHFLFLNIFSIKRFFILFCLFPIFSCITYHILLHYFYIFLLVQNSKVFKIFSLLFRRETCNAYIFHLFVQFIISGIFYTTFFFFLDNFCTFCRAPDTNFKVEGPKSGKNKCLMKVATIVDNNDKML